MMVLHLTRLALSAALAASPPAVAHTSPSVVTNDSTVTLTVDILNKMTAFWKSFMQNPTDIRDTGRRNNQEKITIPIGKVTGVQTPASMQAQVVNMVAMTEKFPAVASNFKTAGLTPQQWEQDRVALFSAAVTNQIDQKGTEKGDGTTLWKNVAALRDHQTEFQALQGSGMFIPKVQMGGGGGGGMGGGDDDLSP